MHGRILVTGANGFLGRHAIHALAQSGWSVVALGRRTLPQTHVAETVQCDLLDAEQTKAVVQKVSATHLLHLAWHDDPRDRWVSPANLDWAAASLSLAHAFATSGGQRMVFAGSCAEYDWAAGAVLSEDTTPLIPSSLYGAAKASTGTLLRAAGSALGLSIAVARIFYCYGPGEPRGRLLPDLMEGLAAGQEIPCTDGLQERDYLHASDIARALTLIAASDLSGAINIASGQATAVRDLIEVTARRMGRPDLPQLGAIARAASDPAKLVGDASRLSALGFVPEFDLERGIADTIAHGRGSA